MPTLSLAGSGTPLEDEYHRALAALSRCPTHEVTFDASRYDPAAVAAAQRMWLVRMQAEHDSVLPLTVLAGQLVDAGATLDAQGVVLRMALDELRHTEICGAAVRALGGDPTCVARTPLRLPAWPSVSAEERALRNVLFGNAFIETVNAANLVDILDSMSDPYLREATRQLLSDEVHHASFGFDYLTAWGPWLAARPEVRASLERWLRRAFAELERARSGAGLPPRELTADEIALGIPDPARVTVVLHHTVQGAIIPALEGFGLDAGAAWRERAHDA
jgi:hypothetical protein